MGVVPLGPLPFCPPAVIARFMCGVSVEARTLLVVFGTWTNVGLPPCFGFVFFQPITAKKGTLGMPRIFIAAVTHTVCVFGKFL